MGRARVIEPSELQGIIFDLDGTLTDTVALVIGCYRDASDPLLDRSYNEEEFLRLCDGPSEEGVGRRLVPERWREFVGRFLGLYGDRIHAQEIRFPGMAETLDTLVQRGTRLGLVTGRGPQSAAMALDAAGLVGRFDPIEIGSPEGDVKVESLRSVLRKWNALPHRVAYVGDSARDVESAREVGALPVAVAWPTSADVGALERAHAAALFRRTDEFSAWLLGRW